MKHQDDLDLMLDASTEILSREITEYAKSVFLGNKAEEKQILSRLGEMFKKLQGVADLLGRKRTMIEIRRKLSRGDTFQESPQTSPRRFSLEFVFDLPFEEALDALLEGKSFSVLDPKTKQGITKEMTWLYGKEAPVIRKFGLELAQENSIKKVREIILDQNLNSLPKHEAVKEIENAISGWSKQTAETIYRTQTAKAYSAGRWRQLENPTIKQFVPAAKFLATLDVNVRPDHKQLNGLIFRVNNPIWKEISPPIYYNCRCHFTLLNKFQLKQMGRLDKQGQVIEDRIPTLPVPRFSGRQDLTTYAFFG